MIDKGRGDLQTESEGGHGSNIEVRNSRADGIVTCRGPRVEFK